MKEGEWTGLVDMNKVAILGGDTVMFSRPPQQGYVGDEVIEQDKGVVKYICDQDTGRAGFYIIPNWDKDELLSVPGHLIRVIAREVKNENIQ